MITVSADKCVNCGSCAAVCPTHHITGGETGPLVHPERPCLRCMHCAAACAGQAIHFDFVPPYAEYPDMPEDDTLKLILTRRSNRHFKAEAPERDDIQWALNMSQWAPSAKNVHPVRWIVIHGKEKCRAVYDLAVDACQAANIMPELVAQREKGNHDSVVCGCSTIILALASDDALYGDTDAVIAATTLELLLRKCGIGSCWGGYLSTLGNRLPSVKTALGVPDKQHISAALLCGYPEGENYCNVPWRPAAQVEWR